MLRISTFIKKNKLAILTFSATVICYFFYNYFRGFGWDGDSFISASQFQKLIGSDLYGLLDGAAHPKLLSIIVFGITYQYTGGFYVLTIISVFLNALMISVIIKWIDQEKGIWIIALFGFLLNIPWTKIVINCDNPAFSIPFSIFGLYFVAHNKNLKGTTFLLISSLFRSGAEFIIFILLINSLIHKNLKNSSILLIFFILSSIHTYWGYLLIYLRFDYFYKITWQYLTTDDSIIKYKHSLMAFIPYFSSILKQLFNKYYILFIVPFIVGLVKILKKPTNIKYILLTPISSLILPIGTFVYGIAHRIYQTKHMGITFMLSIISAFSIDKSIIDKIEVKVKRIITTSIFIFLILINIVSGIIKRGDYEAHVNGTGILGWTNLQEIKNDLKLEIQNEKINILTAYRYLTFVYLDLGHYAQNVEVLKTQDDILLHDIDDYSLIILPSEWNFDDMNIEVDKFVKASNSNYYYYLKRNK